MCDVNCFKWVAKNLTLVEVHGKRVCEVGSYDVNGSLRAMIEMLEPAEYVGVDIAPGPGVDVICPAAQLVEKFGAQSFDLVLSTCALEHIREWKPAVSNIKRICKPNGIILIIVPAHWSYHEFPGDFWRYSQTDLQNIFSDCQVLAHDQDPVTFANAYIKVRKPNEFVENDLHDYRLHSVVVNRAIDELRDRDLQSVYFKWVRWKSVAYTTGWSILLGILSKLA